MFDKKPGKELQVSMKHCFFAASQVASVVGRAEILCSVFYLSSLLAYRKSLHSKQRKLSHRGLSGVEMITYTPLPSRSPVVTSVCVVLLVLIPE